MKNQVTKAVIFRFVILALVVCPILCDFKLLILHTNDMHSRYNEVDQDTARCRDPTSKKCYGGFARLRATIDKLKKDAEKNKMSVLYLDAGDVFQETVYYMEYKWELAVKMMNLLKPDAMSLGNHEFDDGVKGLAPFVRQLQVPIVCCNIDITGEKDLQIKDQLLPSKIFEFGKIKVGVVGYLTQDISSKNLGKVNIRDEIRSLRKETERLKKDGVNIIIALGHSGIVKDKEIAKNVKEVDVVVGGHSHAYLYSGINPSEDKVSGEYPIIVEKKENGKNINKKVPVVQAFYGTKYLGHLELVFNDEGNLKEHRGSLIELNGRMIQDKTILEELELYSKEIKRKYGRKIGQTELLFQGRNKYCRFHECIIGNLITDAFVDYANKKLSTTGGQNKIEIGLLDSKAVKGSLFPMSEGNAGDILLEDVMVVLPYGNSLVVLQMKGRVLRQALESGVNKYDPERGGLKRAHLLQVSGLRVQFDLTKQKGNRLTGVQVAPDYRDINDDASYKVVMSEYLANDKDTFPMLNEQLRVSGLPADARDYDILANYIEEQSPLKAENHQLEGRITIKE